jgi:hypothetical protein
MLLRESECRTMDLFMAPVGPHAGVGLELITYWILTDLRRLDQKSQRDTKASYISEVNLNAEMPSAKRVKSKTNRKSSTFLKL